MAVGIEDLRFDANLHAAKTCARLGFPLTQDFPAIDQNIGMMHIALVAGTNFDRFYPSRLADWNVKNKVPISISSRRGKNEWLLRFQDHVRVAELPTFHKFRRWRQVGRITLNFSLFDPTL